MRAMVGNDVHEQNKKRSMMHNIMRAMVGNDAHEQKRKHAGRPHESFPGSSEPRSLS